MTESLSEAAQSSLQVAAVRLAVLKTETRRTIVPERGCRARPECRHQGEATKLIKKESGKEFGSCRDPSPELKRQWIVEDWLPRNQQIVRD